MLPGVSLLMTGYRTIIDEDVRVVGLGGVYSPRHFYGKKTGKYYTRKDVDSAVEGGGTDVLLTHTAPTELGVKTVVYGTRPKLLIHATHLQSKVYDIMGSMTIALGKEEIIKLEYRDHRFSIID